jgi:hypothetical protein
MTFSEFSLRQCRAVTMSDTDELPDGECLAFYVSAAGDIKYMPAGQTSPVTLPGVPVGFYRLAATRFYETGSTGTVSHAFYA